MAFGSGSGATGVCEVVATGVSLVVLSVPSKCCRASAAEQVIATMYVLDAE